MGKPSINGPFLVYQRVEHLIWFLLKYRNYLKPTWRRRSEATYNIPSGHFSRFTYQRWPLPKGVLVRPFFPRELPEGICTTEYLKLAMCSVKYRYRVFFLNYQKGTLHQTWQWKIHHLVRCFFQLQPPIVVRGFPSQPRLTTSGLARYYIPWYVPCFPMISPYQVQSHHFYHQ